jgi:integrase
MGRDREYLEPEEVGRLQNAAKRNRNGLRDSLMVYMSARHWLRAEELLALKRSALNLKQGRFHVSRVKGSQSSVHPLDGHELRELRRLYEATGDYGYVFVSERGAPLDEVTLRRLAYMSDQDGKTFSALVGFLINHEYARRVGPARSRRKRPAPRIEPNIPMDAQGALLPPDTSDLGLPAPADNLTGTGLATMTSSELLDRLLKEQSSD